MYLLARPPWSRWLPARPPDQLMGALAPESGLLELPAVPLVLLELALLGQREAPSWLVLLSAWQQALLSIPWRRQPCLEQLLYLAFQQQRQ